MSRAPAQRHWNDVTLMGKFYYTANVFRPGASSDDDNHEEAGPQLVFLPYVWGEEDCEGLLRFVVITDLCANLERSNYRPYHRYCTSCLC